MVRGAGGEREGLLAGGEPAAGPPACREPEGRGAGEGLRRALPSRRAAAAAAALGAGLLAASLLAARALSPRPPAGEAAGAVELVGVTSTTIRWLAHPTKCLDVAGSASGAALQIWNCDPKYPFQQGFLVPPEGTTGRIKWAQNPALCLDSPGGHAIQFWDCNDAPAENLLWTVSPDGKGRIHWAAHPEQCVDVPEEKTENGWKLQVWYCEDATRGGMDSNLRFVTHPVDCRWGAWGEWGLCSSSCGGGMRLRARTVAVAALNGGEDCGPDSDESQACGEAPCEASGATLLPGSARDPAFLHRAETTLAPTAPAISQLLPEKDVRPVSTRSGALRRLASSWALLLALPAVLAA